MSMAKLLERTDDSTFMKKTKRQRTNSNKRLKSLPLSKVNTESYISGEKQRSENKMLLLDAVKHRNWWRYFE